MARQPTFPTLFDEVNQLSITFLKKYGYLNLNKFSSGVITWTSRNTGKKSEINIHSIRYESHLHFIELNYSYGKESRDYLINIEFTPSNLGTGEIMYFICPKTGLRCRKLYCIDGWFFHRKAFKGCYYDTQIVCKKFRPYTLALNFNRDSHLLHAELHKKYRKTHYRGKKTKIVQRLERKIELANRGGEMFDVLVYF